SAHMRKRWACGWRCAVRGSGAAPAARIGHRASDISGKWPMKTGCVTGRQNWLGCEDYGEGSVNTMMLARGGGAKTIVPCTRLRPSFLPCGAHDGMPLVLLHGAASNSLMWIADVDQLARQHRVFAVDVIGEPGLSAAARPPWKGPAYSDWLSDVCDSL